MQPEPVIDYLDTEDMSMWYDRKRVRFYGVFHAHIFIGMITSIDGTHWTKATEYIFMPKSVFMSDGTILKPDRLERPFVYTENDEPKVFSLAVKKGDESYSIFIPVRENKIPQPNSRQLAWQNDELGVVFHCDLHVFDRKRYVQGDPVGKYWMPAMSDAPLRGYYGRHEWFWEPGDESHIFPVKQLMDMYLHSVGHNSTLILGITPDTSGQIPGADVQRLKAFREAIRRRFSKPFAYCIGGR